MDLALPETAVRVPSSGRQRRAIRFLLLAGPGLAALLPAQLLWRVARRARPSPVVRTYHRLLARALRFEVEIVGAPEAGALHVANHVSWADIVALGAATPATFVARADLARWPVLGALARLAGTVFVARHRRAGVRGQVGQIAEALRAGTVVLFAEGTTGDGGSVLPFRSALFAAATRVQPVSLQWRPAGRPWRPGERAGFAWDGDKAFLPHAREIICGTSMLCRITYHAAFDADRDRKAAAARARAAIVAALD
jgi:1-acyl-sn-glycerol-3-phosphate acyltransferase